MNDITAFSCHSQHQDLRGNLASSFYCNNKAAGGCLVIFELLHLFLPWCFYDPSSCAYDPCWVALVGFVPSPDVSRFRQSHHLKAIPIRLFLWSTRLNDPICCIVYTIAPTHEGKLRIERLCERWQVSQRMASFDVLPICRILTYKPTRQAQISWCLLQGHHSTKSMGKHSRSSLNIGKHSTLSRL